MRGRHLISCLYLLAASSFSAAGSQSSRPNILLIVADDLGYADLGAFGSDIRTPNIDAIAAEGLIFTNFYTSPSCQPTRAMLMSGNNNHVAGVGRQHASPLIDMAAPGFEGHLSDRVVPFPVLLKRADYRTYMTGKWHLGNAPEHGPANTGFDRSFSLLHGASSHFSSTGGGPSGSLYRQDGVNVDFPDGAYTTKLFTDRLIEFIDADKDDPRPFFAYAAYTAPHWPLQVPDNYLDLYAGQYEEGYDRLREQRFNSLKRAGITPKNSMLPPRNDAIRPWDRLDSAEKRIEARKMELYAAMVENLDHHVGRLIDYLQANGMYEDTLVVFMSDNGAAGEDYYYQSPFLQQHYDNRYENMGRPGSWVSYGPQWAEAGSAPFSRYKAYTREGGMRTPMIIKGPGVPRGEIHRSYVTVMDLAPTFLSLADQTYPSGGSIRPMLGESLLPALTGDADTVHAEDYVMTLHYEGRAFIRQGRWKLVNLDPPFDESEFQLYDLIDDPGEATDLRNSHPDKYAQLLDLWQRTRRDLGIIVPSEL
jgi:arylsulfatase A-like enzyme